MPRQAQRMPPISFSLGRSQAHHSNLELTLWAVMRSASLLTSGLWSVLSAYDSTLPQELTVPTKQRESPTLATITCRLLG